MSSYCPRPHAPEQPKVLVLVLKDCQNTPVLMRTAHGAHPLFMTLKCPWYPMDQNPHFILLNIFAYISIKQVAWLICPCPRPQGQLQYTVLVLTALKVLVLKDDGTV